MEKKDILNQEIVHCDIKSFDATPIIESYEKMAFQARNTAKAAKIFQRMVADKSCSVILCIAGSLFSAGLKKTVVDLLEHNMVDAIVSNGAMIVDQDFFEALGFKHYTGSPFADDGVLQKNMVDRIYDTYIDEEQLRVCDDTITKIADELPPGSYSSREFIGKMGEYLDKNRPQAESVVLTAYRKKVPIFVPAFSDCSAGFGLVLHQWRRKGKDVVRIDSVKDFLELTRIKIWSEETGLFMISGGVPKNFAQDITVAAELILDKDVKMHRYAVQITVADERDGALSGSTLKEAHSWGKVSMENEQMVYAEATTVVPLIASFVYHKMDWKERSGRQFAGRLDTEPIQD